MKSANSRRPRQPRRVVLFADTSALLLSDVRRTASGEVKSGYVVNGGWQFEVQGSECVSKWAGRVVYRWPKPDNMSEIVVPDSWTGTYDEILHRVKSSLGLDKTAAAAEEIANDLTDVGTSTQGAETVTVMIPTDIGIEAGTQGSDQ
jgi:hypothetical protein